MKKVGVLIVSHSDLSLSMVKAMNMVVGEQKDVYAVGLTEGIVSFGNELYGALDKLLGLYTDIIICADLFGGTPYNQSLKYKFENDAKNIHIITGFNFAMLAELSFKLDTDESIDEIINSITQTAKDGITNDLDDKTLEEDDDDDFID